MDLNRFIRNLSDPANESPTGEPKSSGCLDTALFPETFKLEVDEAKVPIEQRYSTEMLERIPSQPPLEQGPLNTQQHAPNSPSLQKGQQERSAGFPTVRFGPGMILPPHRTDERVVGT
jgi:hypothetical protein